MTRMADPTTIKLLLCPFCGASDGLSFECAGAGAKWGRVECGCGAAGPEVPTDYEDVEHWAQAAADEWNKRANAPRFIPR
jgi:Restriction alleviation protein Lar